MSGDENPSRRLIGWSQPSFGRILLDPTGETAGVAASSPAPSTPATDPSSRPAESSNTSTRPTLDLSGVSAEELNAVPDLSGGGDTTPDPTTTAPAAPAAPADPNLAASLAAGTTTPTPAAPQAGGLRAMAAQFGIDLSAFPDDATAFAAMAARVQQAQQPNYYATLGQQLAPHAAAIQQYLAAQRAQAAAPPAKPSWEPPPFEERWLDLVTKDPATGIYAAKPGVDPSIATKVQDRADWLTKFQRDPMAAVAPMVKDEAAKIARQVIDATLSRQQASQSANAIVEQNAPWMYQHDTNGQRYVDQQGHHIPTPAGTYYLQQVQSLHRNGMRDVNALNAVATQLTAAAFAQRAPAAPAVPVATQQAITHPPVNAAQASPAPRRMLDPAASDPSDAGLSLYERMRRDMASGGVTDADFRPGFGD